MALKETTIQEKIAALERVMKTADFWRDKAKAQARVAELARLKSELSAPAGGGRKVNAILSISAGAGGDDAEDFVRLLYEMYCRFAEKQGLKVLVIHRQQNDYGGYRRITFLIQAAYGILKNEAGVHRLIRRSPFSEKGLRHTSFALVEVLPELPPEEAVTIDPKEIKVEFFKASGPGGQNVNKRETAVRVTHRPTGLHASASAERSQEQNRRRALAILRAKLQQLALERRAEAEAGRLAKTVEPAWGRQIRSYILQPYKLVKDHRSKREVSDVEGVLAGNLEPFLQ